MSVWLLMALMPNNVIPRIKLKENLIIQRLVLAPGCYECLAPAGFQSIMSGTRGFVGAKLSVEQLPSAFWKYSPKIPSCPKLKLEIVQISIWIRRWATRGLVLLEFWSKWKKKPRKKGVIKKFLEMFSVGIKDPNQEALPISWELIKVIY